MLCREGCVSKRQFSTSVFTFVQVFKMSFENSMILPAALSGRFFIFEALVSFACCERCPCRALSHMYCGWASFSAKCCCREWASFSAHFWASGICFSVSNDGTATIRTIGRRVEYVDNHQNCRSKSGICCRVQTGFLRVNGCCSISVHVPTSFCCCEMQPVVLGDEKKCQSVFFLILPRECFVLYCKTVENRSRKSGDLLQT